MEPSNPKRILIVCPSFPAPESGAEQADRAQGMRQLRRLGHEIVVIAKAVEWADRTLIERTAHEMGVRVVLVPYRYSNKTLSTQEKMFKFLGRLRNPLYFDGAAYEYAERTIREVLRKELQEFKPNIVWFEYTYLWPLYGQVRKTGAKIITRSINFEPEHFLEEDGRTLKNYIKFVPKFLGELITLWRSDLVFAITPREETLYRRLLCFNVRTLPLRALPKFVELPRPALREGSPLHMVFMGSSYAVAHNKAAARFLLEKVMPALQAQAPGEFVLHITGGKLPQELAAGADGKNVVYEGYVPDLTEFLKTIDVGVALSLMGAGMQQKVFEPIVRGFPTVASPRAIAGYALRGGTDYIAAQDTEEFVAGLVSLRSVERRRVLAGSASKRSQELFSRERLDGIVQSALQNLWQT